MLKGKVKVKLQYKPESEIIVTKKVVTPWGDVLESGSDDFKTGDVVLFAPSSGANIGDDTYIIDESEIMAVL